jgi:diacylglycerol O-acyltransferase
MPLSRVRLDEIAYDWIGDRNAPMQLGLLGEFDAGSIGPPDGGPLTDRVIEELAARAARVPSLARRILWTRPGEGRPVWVDDPDFEPRRHLSAVPAPREADLPTWAAERAAQPLGGLLWRADVVELMGDRFAVLVVLSHVLADGQHGVAVLVALLDGSAGGDHDRVDGPGVRERRPTHRELVRDRRREAAAALRGPRRAASPRRRRRGHGLRAALRDFAGAEPDTGLPRRIGRSRLLGVVRVPLGELRSAAHRHGVSVNDLLLTGVTGGLRRLLLAQGAAVSGLALRCTVPATTGRPGEQVSDMLVVRLPVAVPEPDRCLALIHRSRTAGKARLRAAGSGPAAARLAFWLARPVLRAVRRFGSRRVTLAVADVVGPPGPLWLAGAELRRATPIAPVAPLVPVSFVALSYAGTLTISVNADGAVPDLDAMTDGMDSWFRELIGGRAR